MKTTVCGCLSVKSSLHRFVEDKQAGEIRLGYRSAAKTFDIF